MPGLFICTPCLLPNVTLILTLDELCHLLSQMATILRHEGLFVFLCIFLSTSPMSGSNQVLSKCLLIHFYWCKSTKWAEDLCKDWVCSDCLW